MGKNCTKQPAARAAQLLFLIQPMKSLICGIVVARAAQFFFLILPIKSFNVTLLLLSFPSMMLKLPIECVHMTSRRPCWRSKQRNGGHLGGVKYSFGGLDSIFMQSPPFVSLCIYGFWSHERTHSIEHSGFHFEMKRPKT